MCCGGDYCFAVLACEFLQVISDDFCGVSVQRAAKFV